MNHIAAYPVPVPRGFHAMVRLSHKAQPWPLMEGDRPKVFPTSDAARIAAQAHVIDHINGTLVRDGERCAPLKAAADKWFRKGRAIEIARNEVRT